VGDAGEKDDEERTETERDVRRLGGREDAERAEAAR
jgi:hypothetical protein